MKTIFVSTDFSTAGNNAVKFATQLAAATGSRLAVFNSVHPPFDPKLGEQGQLQLEKDKEAAEQKKLDLVLNGIFDDLGIKRSDAKVSASVKVGIFAADNILRSAEAAQADLLIIGTHGATGMKMLGSITCDLIFKAEMPVLSIPPHWEYRKIKTIVYATDLKNTVNELRRIASFAGKLDAGVEVFNLDFGENETAPLSLENLRKELKYKKIELIIHKAVKGMTMLEQVEDYVETRKPEILVMFPEERTVLDKIFMRSKTEKLAYHVRLPLLTFLKSLV
jgi:nucleotide-binding universal stress UspA family protein